LAFLSILAAGCGRPDGGNNLQVLSPSLITTPTVEPTVIPTPLVIIAALPTPLSATSSPAALGTPTPAPEGTSEVLVDLQITPTRPPTPTPTPTVTATPTPIPTATPLPTPPPDPRIAEGRQLFLAFGCSSCHEVTDIGAPAVPEGPSLDDLRIRAGLQVPGLQPKVYLRESLLEPQVFLAGEFPTEMPELPEFIAAQAVDALIEYLFSLGEGEPQIAEVPEPTIADNVIVFDSLKGSGDLTQRAPLKGPEHTSWIIESGDWLLSGRGVTESSGINADQRAIIDAGTSDVLITVDFRHSEGIAGIVYRYVDSLNWNMVWYGDEIGQFFFGTLIEGAFSGAPGADFVWGETAIPRELQLRVIGTQVTLRVDSIELSALVVETHKDATSFGIFNRRSEKNRFANFELSQPEP